MEPESAPAEREIARLRAQYQALVEQIPAVLYVNEPDDEATTIYVSPQTNAILGISEDAWFANEWEDRVHRDDVDHVDQTYIGFIRHAREGVDEYRFIRPDGEEIWIHDRVRVIRDEAGTPLLVQGVMFDITEQKRAQEILRRQAQLRERVDVIARQFTDLVLHGADLDRLLEALAGIVRNPVVLEDTAHQVIAFAERSADVVALLSQWPNHSRDGHVPEPDGGGVTTTAGSPSCTWIPVRMHDEEWGRLHLLEAEDPADEIDRLALDRAAAAIGISLLSGRDSEHLADTARAELVSEIWQGRWSSAREVLARMQSLGAQVAGTNLVAATVEASTTEVAGPTGSANGPAPSRRTRQAVLDALRAALAAAGLDGLPAALGDKYVAIVSVPPPDRSGLLDVFAAQALAGVAEQLPRHLVVLGLSRPSDSENLRRALDEAGEAAAYGSRVAAEPSVYRFEDLGLLRLLGRLSDGPELSSFVETELGPLLDHDAVGRTPLLATLGAYFESGGRKADAARALHLERRSLYYRLDRIEALLGRRLDEPATRLRLEVALQSLDLLQRRSRRRLPSVGPLETAAQPSPCGTKIPYRETPVTLA